MTGYEFNYPRVGVAVAIRRLPDEVLLHLRKGLHMPGCWAFPGGHLEKWETWEDAVVREKDEEAGSQLRITKPVFWTVRNTPFRTENKHYVVILMISDWVTGEPCVMEPHKNAGWAWHSWNNLPSPLMMGIQDCVNNGLNPFDVKV
jgi:8-oxo-dGTP diphosphatase